MTLGCVHELRLSAGIHRLHPHFCEKSVAFKGDGIGGWACTFYPTSKLTPPQHIATLVNFQHLLLCLPSCLSAHFQLSFPFNRHPDMMPYPFHCLYSHIVWLFVGILGRSYCSVHIKAFVQGLFLLMCIHPLKMCDLFTHISPTAQYLLPYILKLLWK